MGKSQLEEFVYLKLKLYALKDAGDEKSIKISYKRLLMLKHQFQGCKAELQTT